MFTRLRHLAGRVRKRFAFELARPDANQATSEHHRVIEWALVEQVRRALLADPKYQDSRRLAKYGFKAYSQYDEDGILNEIYRRIGTTNRYFVEFGVGAGLENNTLYRLADGWQGTWLEGAAESVHVIRKRFGPLIAANRLTLVEAFVTAEDIQNLLAKAQVPSEFDLLSIDIDGNDYWVWQAIDRYRPRVLVVEYNAGLGPSLSWAMPYRPDFVTDRSRAFGASLKAFELLGRAKGYALVGCGMSGVNAFFVRVDLVGDRFFEPFDSETHYEPPRYPLLPFPGHAPSYHEVAAIVAGPPVVPSHRTKDVKRI